MQQVLRNFEVGLQPQKFYHKKFAFKKFSQPQKFQPLKNSIYVVFTRVPFEQVNFKPGAYLVSKNYFTITVHVY